MVVNVETFSDCVGLCVVGGCAGWSCGLGAVDFDDGGVLMRQRSTRWQAAYEMAQEWMEAEGGRRRRVNAYYMNQRARLILALSHAGGEVDPGQADPAVSLEAGSLAGLEQAVEAIREGWNSREIPGWPHIEQSHRARFALATALSTGQIVRASDHLREVERHRANGRQGWAERDDLEAEVERLRAIEALAREVAGWNPMTVFEGRERRAGALERLRVALGEQHV